jgi:hypothetical protein
MANPPPKTFELGLAMAGAISAGAYSGGVLDFLLQALDEWQKAKADDRPDIPNHQVIIKVMSGASAGAITGAIGAVALAGGLQPQPFENPGPRQQKYRCMLPNLYDAWVVRPRLVAAHEGGTDLLSLEDLSPKAGEPTVTSVLNSVLLDQIGDASLNVTPSGKLLPYVAKDFHVYLTLSNLRGVPYAIEFDGGGYGMQSHGDRVHYVVNGLGSWDTPSTWASKDFGKPINVSALVGPGGPTRDWKDFALSAIASGAFPVGLAPRQIATTTDAYATRYLPIDMPALVYNAPSWPSPWFQLKPRDFTFLSVDGGVINNEPFEYARYTLMIDPPKPNERLGADADRAVIMIDPFPQPPSFAGDGKPAADLVSAVAALFPALVNQARFKPSELMEAVKPDVFSRFLIAPHRHLAGKEDEELYAIACGLLGGFGGFLDEKFRQHDYQLGRRNCQRFLRDVLALPADNEIIKAWPDNAKTNLQFQTLPRKDATRTFCIIPLLGSASDSEAEVVLPEWPRISQQDFDELQDRIDTRLKALTPVLIERQTASRILRVVLKVAAASSKGRILDFVKFFILSDLVRRDQIAGWELSNEATSPHAAQDVRKVLGELAHPSYDFRTVNGIYAATGLKSDDIVKILSFLKGQAGKPYLAWQSAKPDGTPIYTLASRKPNDIWQWPIVRSVGDWFAAPVIN